MVFNLQEMGLVGMGHKSDIPSRGTRWPRPGKGSGVCCGVMAYPGWAPPRLTSTQTSTAPPQQLSSLNVTTKAGKTQTSPTKQLLLFLVKRRVLREPGQISSPASASSHTVSMLLGPSKEHVVANNNSPNKNQNNKNKKGAFPMQHFGFNLTASQRRSLDAGVLIPLGCLART